MQMPMIPNTLYKYIRIENDTENKIEIGFKWLGYEEEHKQEIQKDSSWGTLNIAEITLIQKI